MIFFCVCFAIVQFEFSRNANVHDDDFSLFYHLIKSSVVVYSDFAVPVLPKLLPRTIERMAI